ncbi:MAG: DinB family protein [Chloroflexi bacterium]|nr:DinB family protein [Chloroflexota bacterium]MYJ93657.1 DinB family protein [Chloroflexota bacterium]
MPQRPIADDERQRVSSYLLSQGEKYSWLALWPRVVDARIDFLNTLNRVSPEQAAWKPAPEDWSIEEVAQHVLDGSRRNADMIANLAFGREPNLGPQGIGAIDPAQRAAALSWPDLVDALLDDSRQFSNVIDGLPEPPAFEPRPAHPFFGPLHSRGWFMFQRVHDLDHVNQVNAIKETAGYPEGPSP